MNNARIYEPIKHQFTPDELRELGEQLAREVQSVFSLRDQKASVVANLGAQIKATEKTVSEITMRLNNGFEIRDVECMYDMDNPRVGMKSLLRCDNPAEVVRIEAMTLDEQQQSFRFGESDRPGEGA